jgi:hypothetical protein
MYICIHKYAHIYLDIQRFVREKIGAPKKRFASLLAVESVATIAVVGK